MRDRAGSCLRGSFPYFPAPPHRCRLINSHVRSNEPKYFASAIEFRLWLGLHATTAAELMVGFWKVDSGRPSMTWSESVDEALCFGWIDGVRRRIDDHAYQIRFTPRKKTSIWSAVNIAKVEQLTAEGRMTEAGAQAFAHRTDGRSVVYAYEQGLQLQNFGRSNGAKPGGPTSRPALQAIAR